MLTTVVLLAALGLAPAQTGELALTNPRVTFGELGPTRPDTKFLPGDLFFLSFDIDNLKVDASGNVSYTMAMDVRDKEGKPVFKQDPADRTETIPLGGNRLPARAFVFLGTDQPAGTYTCEVVVTDKQSKQSKKITQDFVVSKKDFGIVSFMCTADDQQQCPAPLGGVVGQALWLHFVVTAFDRDPKTQQPDLEVKIGFKDADGSPTTKPQVLKVNKGVQPKDSGVPVAFRLSLNRPGKFTIEMEATDAVTKKSAKLSFPVTVVEQAK
jgi:hypothetical protein